MYNTTYAVRVNRCICCDNTFKASTYREYCSKCARAIKSYLPTSLVLEQHERRIPEEELRARIDAVIDSYNS